MRDEYVYGMTPRRSSRLVISSPAKVVFSPAKETTKFVLPTSGEQIFQWRLKTKQDKGLVETDAVSNFHDLFLKNFNRVKTVNKRRETDYTTPSTQETNMCQTEAMLITIRTTNLVHYVDDWLYTIAHCSKTRKHLKSTESLEPRPDIWDMYKKQHIEVYPNSQQDTNIQSGDLVLLMGACLKFCTGTNIQINCNGKLMKSDDPCRNVCIKIKAMKDTGVGKNSIKRKSHNNNLLAVIANVKIDTQGSFHFITYSTECDTWFDSAGTEKSNTALIKGWKEGISDRELIYIIEISLNLNYSPDDELSDDELSDDESPDDELSDEGLIKGLRSLVLEK